MQISSWLYSPSSFLRNSPSVTYSEKDQKEDPDIGLETNKCISFSMVYKIFFCSEFPLIPENWGGKATTKCFAFQAKPKMEYLVSTSQNIRFQLLE